jgi:hypothetical protein
VRMTASSPPYASAAIAANTASATRSSISVKPESREWEIGNRESEQQ